MSSPVSTSSNNPGLPVLPELELLQLIGSGSYGEVWLARNPLGTLRAVKIVRRSEFDDDRPYEREFAGIRKFEPISRSHEGFVDLLQVGRNDEEGYFYYVMELADAVDGGSSEIYEPRTLAAAVKTHGPLPLDECLRVARTLSGALAELHRQGLVHRDIKPSNIIFVNGVPKLADIGLVAPAHEARSFVGTEGYIPPEGPGTPQADLYSLGIVLYVISTGKSHRDFPEPPADLMSRSDQDRWLELQAIVHRASQADPTRRYASAHAMLVEIEFLERGYSIVRQRARQRRWAIGKKSALAGVILFVMASVSTILLRQRTRSDLAGEGPPSKNSDANNLCEEGLLIVRGDIYAEFGKAYTNFQKAIELDPHFARPYAGLIELQVREWQPGIKPMDQEELGIIVERLEKLGPDLAVTLGARAVLSYRSLNFPEAEKLMKRAVKMSPNYELARTDYGFMLMTWGWPVEARKQLEIGLEIAPSKATIYCWIGHTYRAARDYTNAIAWYRKTLEYREHHAWAYGALKETYEALGDYENAIENAEKENLAHGADPAGCKQKSDALFRAFRERGARGYYEQLWKLAEEDPNEQFYRKGCLQMRLGNPGAALDCLEKSVQAKLRNGTLEQNFKWLLMHDCWDAVRGDPRFKQILKQTSFWEVMPRRKRGGDGDH